MTMSSLKPQQSMDEKKMKRKISNRESAKRSRMRKKQLEEDLTKEITRIQFQNRDILRQIDHVREKFTVVEADNDVLRARAGELTERLKSLIGVMKSIGMDGDVSELTGSVFQPLKLPCSSVMASSSELLRPQYGAIFNK